MPRLRFLYRFGKWTEIYIFCSVECGQLRGDFSLEEKKRTINRLSTVS